MFGYFLLFLAVVSQVAGQYYWYPRPRPVAESMYPTAYDYDGTYPPAMLGAGVYTGGIYDGYKAPGVMLPARKFPKMAKTGKYGDQYVLVFRNEVAYKAAINAAINAASDVGSPAVAVAPTVDVDF